MSQDEGRLKMTSVKIEIDTEGEVSKGHPFSPHAPADNKVALLSSIKLSNDLIEAFETGLGRPADENEHNTSYLSSKIVDAKNSLKVKGVKVIVAVGGAVVLDALQSEPTAITPPFVSLV